MASHQLSPTANGAKIEAGWQAGPATTDACCASTPTWPGGSPTAPAVSHASLTGRWFRRYRGSARSWRSSSARSCPRLLPSALVLEVALPPRSLSRRCHGVAWNWTSCSVGSCPRHRLPRWRQMAMPTELPLTLLLMPMWPLSKATTPRATLLASPLRRTSTQRLSAPSSTGCATARSLVPTASSGGPTY